MNSTNLPPEVINAILTADSKALATTGKHGINVVPVSSVLIMDKQQIWLMDYFMKKTSDNLRENPEVALVCWSGMSGYQLKGKVKYVTDGPEFERATEWVSRQFPGRKLKGLIVLIPFECYNIAPQAESKPSLRCEHPYCTEKQGVVDYVRLPSDVEKDEEGILTAEEQQDWLKEPIALCPAHAGNREPFKK